MFWIATQVVYLQHCLVVTWLVPCETAAILVRSVYTIQSCTMSYHFVQSHIHKVHVCLTVTCRLHFRQNDWDLLHATVVTQGWNRYWSRVSSTESWPWRRKISHYSCWCLNLQPFDHESGALSTELSSLPRWMWEWMSEMKTACSEADSCMKDTARVWPQDHTVTGYLLCAPGVCTTLKQEVHAAIVKSCTGVMQCRHVIAVPHVYLCTTL